jgi:hypothetical protein
MDKSHLVNPVLSASRLYKSASAKPLLVHEHGVFREQRQAGLIGQDRRGHLGLVVQCNAAERSGHERDLARRDHG